MRESERETERERKRERIAERERKRERETGPDHHILNQEKLNISSNRNQFFSELTRNTFSSVVFSLTVPPHIYFPAL